MYFCIFEDTEVGNFLPLVHLRPVYELRCGILSLQEKIERMFSAHTKIVLHARHLLAASLAEGFPDRVINHLPDDDTWFVNGRILADDGLKKMIRRQTNGPERFMVGDAVAAAYVDRATLTTLRDQLRADAIGPSAFQWLPARTFIGRMVKYPWDLIHENSEEIERDFKAVAARRGISGKIYPGVHLVNRRNISIGSGSILKPGVVVDAEKGPVAIGKNVTLMPNAVVEGPASIGDHTIVKVGAKIYHGTSIGEWCKVGGEVDASIMQSYSNKQHDGFLGHSYIGSWVNLGAGTNTSDLKNTYGNVKVQMRGQLLDTGSQFVGLMMGDHSKSGINVMFDTGTVVGILCNVYGAGLPPKFLPSFSWGGGKTFSTYDLDKGIETARRVMARRNVKMSTAYEKVVRSVFMLTDREREATRDS